MATEDSHQINQPGTAQGSRGKCFGFVWYADFLEIQFGYVKLSVAALFVVVLGAMHHIASPNSVLKAIKKTPFYYDGLKWAWQTVAKSSSQQLDQFSSPSIIALSGWPWSSVDETLRRWQGSRWKTSSQRHTTPTKHQSDSLKWC